MKKVLITLIILAIPITIYFIYNSNKESDENQKVVLSVGRIL